jgi:regulator of cell morphogenesis and NO signaling
MNKFRNKPIGQIVAENLETAKVFENHDMDFCCHGNQTLEKACKAHCVSIEQIETELLASIQSLSQDHKDVNVMSLDELTQHIVAVHHVYTKKVLPAITKHLDTVVKVHGKNHPELNDILKNFSSLRKELEAHLEKEEKSIFPYIAALEGEGALRPVGFNGISKPVAELEQEHERAGRVFDYVNKQAQGYKVPKDACNTYRLVLKELQELEQDLHLHIALENYLLFPKAIKCEQRRSKKC